MHAKELLDHIETGGLIWQPESFAREAIGLRYEKIEVDGPELASFTTDAKGKMLDWDLNIMNLRRLLEDDDWEKVPAEFVTRFRNIE